MVNGRTSTDFMFKGRGRVGDETAHPRMKKATVAQANRFKPAILCHVFPGSRHFSTHHRSLLALTKHLMMTPFILNSFLPFVLVSFYLTQLPVLCYISL
jgi:hypothetical protein